MGLGPPPRQGDEPVLRNYDPCSQNLLQRPGGQ